MPPVNQPPKPIGDTTARVLKYLRAYIAKHHDAPMYSEITKECHLTDRTHARYHILQLERHGFLRLGPRGAHRSITLVEVPA